MLALKPQKFALSFTCGSITFMASFGIMKGPYEHLVSMFTADRMLFTTIYFGSILATLYLTCTKGGMKGYALVLIASGKSDLLLLLLLNVSLYRGGGYSYRDLTQLNLTYCILYYLHNITCVCA